MSVTKLIIKIKMLSAFLVVVLSVYATLAKPSRPLVFKLVRSNALKDKKLSITKERDATMSHLSPSRSRPVFLAKLFIGEPPVPQLLYVDSGSSFTWIKCRACNTCGSQFPVYDPTRSSTYTSVSCDDSSYESSPALAPVKRTGECHYLQEYFDGSESKGTLAKETLRFDTEDEGLFSVSDVDFGCASHVTNGFDIGSGRLGLSYGKFSILKKFSLCFGTLESDPFSDQGVLSLGDGARMTGASTSLFMKYGHYHVDMEIVSINGRDIPNHLASIKGNTIIDTGTTMLYLAGEAYNELENQIDNLLDEHLNSFNNGGMVCYNGTIHREFPLLPTITLTFYKGATLKLDPTSLFHQLEDDFFCLAAMMSPEGIDHNIIGTTALQNYNIGFDIEDETVYFDKISCDYLY